MSGTDLKIRAFFPDEEKPKVISESLNSTKNEIEIDFAIALDSLSLDDSSLESNYWSMSYATSWKTCLTVNLYGRGDEEIICTIFESLGAVLISVKAFDDRVGEHYEYGWRNGKSIKLRTLNSELKKLDPYIAFHEAIKKGHVRKVQEFIKEGIDFRAPLQGVMTPLMHAAYYGKANVIKVLVESGDDVNTTITGNRNALLYSLLNLKDQLDHDDLSTIQVLLEYGANPNILSSNLIKSDLNNISSRSKDIAPLMLAAECSVDAVEILIKYKANVNQSNSQGFTPLMFSLEGYGSRSIPVTLLLIKHGANINAEDIEGKSCLDYAGRTSEEDVILRSFGAKYKPVEYTDNDKDNLLLAISIDDVDMVKKLSESFNVNDEIDLDTYKTWAIKDAITKRRYEIVELLIELGADLQKIDSEYIQYRNQRESLLFCACKAGRLNTIKTLLENGIDTSFIDRRGKSAMDSVFKSKFPEEYSEVIPIIQLLLEYNVPIGSSLISAIESCNDNIVELIYNANALEQVEDYKKLFFTVVSSKNLSFIKKHCKWMIENGFSLFQFTSYFTDTTYLDFNKEAISIFVKNNIDVNELFENTYYLNPLNSLIMALVESGSINNKKSQSLIDILDILLSAGAIPDNGLKESDPSLIMRLQKKKDRISIIKKLIVHGADINYVSELEPGSSYELLIKDDMFEGSTTSLMLAAANGNLDLVKLLIEHGADPKFVNPVEGSLLQVAERFNRKSVISYLKKDLGLVE